MKDKKEFSSEIDLNKCSEGCLPCVSECKKIDQRIHKRNLSEINKQEVPHILKVFDF